MRTNYVREFSEIPSLQHAGRINYCLSLKDGEYHITAKQSFVADAASRIEDCELPEIARALAERLLLLLYENAVPLENLRDVIADCCVAAMARG
jgi:hypothetical protein